LGINVDSYLDAEIVDTYSPHVMNYWHIVFT